MMVVVKKGSGEGGGGKELLSFVDGTKPSGVMIGMYSISYPPTTKLVWQNW